MRRRRPEEATRAGGGAPGVRPAPEYPPAGKVASEDAGEDDASSEVEIVEHGSMLQMMLSAKNLGYCNILVYLCTLACTLDTMHSTKPESKQCGLVGYRECQNIVGPGPLQYLIFWAR